MSLELRVVYLVGGNPGDCVPDAYASRGDAIETIMGYIYSDHWLSKLSKDEIVVLTSLRSQPEVAINMYNRFAKDGDRWFLTEVEVRCEPNCSPA